MTIVFLLGFGAIALAAVLLPLLTQAGEARQVGGLARRDEGSGHVSLDEQEAAALVELRDLEFDLRGDEARGDRYERLAGLLMERIDRT